ncbi:GntR family transcriptional regulator, partial [Arachidicoccus sp.]|uniref:GntR family transcriptional regulator n=1 Tax=Arachidicoccus sp. TaxID=1872624 RepID=UPI003D1B7395
MHSENIYNTIEFDNYSITPKYIQLANSISKRIEDGTIEDAYILPSINNISYELDLSRNTVEKAYRHLKERGFINSVPGKGYFVQKTNTKGQIKIFLIFNKLSVHKKIIYDAFANALGNNVIIDFYIYNNDFSLFKKLLTRRKIEYSYYVIIPHFMDDNEKAYEIINQSIPEGKLILMSQLLNNIVGSYGAIYEDFERNIYGTLSKAIEQLKKYNKLNIIFPEYTYHPNTILKGFSRFCQDYAFDYGILNNIQTVQIEKHAVYIS